MSCDFGRYYTKDIFSSILIENIEEKNPKTVIDLGVGDGSLLNSAIKKWNQSSFIAVDINKNGCDKLKKQFPLIDIYHQDALKFDFINKLSLKQKVDIAICNPPYLSTKINQDHKDILIKANLEELIKLRNISTDIIFLAQNLRLLKKGGELGIILPDTLLTGYNYQIFREVLLKKHKIKAIFELPEKCFSKTEAQTYILLLKKCMTTNKKVPLYKLNNKGQKTEPIYINKNDLVHRMDYSYYNWKTNNLSTCSISLNDIEAKITRGSLNNTYCKKNNIDIFHTSNFDKNIRNISFGKKDINTNNIIAQKGDILLARVGKRNIGKCVMVKDGTSLVSDCIFRIRVKKEYQNALFKKFKSKLGQKWLQAYAHGVCAKVISKRDLMEFPIY